jgi:hypothetical protein
MTAGDTDTDQLLDHAKRQTKALEALERYAFYWTVAFVLVGVVGLIVALNN